MQIPGVRGGMVMDEIDTCITIVHLTSLTFASFLCTSKIKEALQVALTSVHENLLSARTSSILSKSMLSPTDR